MNKFIDTLKEFFKSLFSSQNETISSKRVCAVIGSFVLFTIALCNLFFKLTIAEFIFYGILGFVMSLFGLNTIISAKSINSKQDVANNVINKEPNDQSSEIAKEILQSDKP